ncbi:MAG TPA: hypothetical protein VLX92_12365 [Kofleriaceae bacterium]|nr:hypothetical protein [Kofleriaceae bacterium]
MKLALVAAVALAAPAAGAPRGEVVRVEHRDPGALPSRGPSNAPVTIELFFTPGQGSRNTTYRNLEKLQAAHPTRIRLVYRILGVNGSARLQYAALEAYAEGRFFELMDRINRDRTTYTDAQLIDLAKEVGIDPDRLTAAMRDPPPAYRTVIDANDRRRRQKFRGGALPAALFNGRVWRSTGSAPGMSELEAQYRDAKAMADDLIDRGADPARLAEAFDAESAPRPLDVAVIPGPTDEELDQLPADAPLVQPPLPTAGMPWFGAADPDVTITVLCSPTSQNCNASLRAAIFAEDNYPDRVRVVWMPYFDVARDDAADLALLGDAAMCAERVGTSSENDFDRPSSPGWRWVEAVLQASSAHRRRVPAEQLIDEVADRLRVDRPAFETCRAQLAGSSVTVIEAARHAGVRTTPATIVGGRAYPPINDWYVLQQLVEDELSPNDCERCLHLGDLAPAWRHGL